MAFHALIAVPLSAQRPGGPLGRSGAGRARATANPASHGSSPYEPQRIRYPCVNGNQASPCRRFLGARFRGGPGDGASVASRATAEIVWTGPPWTGERETKPP